MSAKITLTVSEEKAVRAIVREAERLGAAAQSLHSIVGEFLYAGDAVITLETLESRAELLRKGEAYKAAPDNIKACIRKAVQRCKDQVFPNRERKGTKTPHHKGTKAPAKAKAKAKAPAAAIEHSTPKWVAELPDVILTWAEHHEVQVLAALQQAFDRDLAATMRQKAA